MLLLLHYNVTLLFCYWYNVMLLLLLLLLCYNVMLLFCCWYNVMLLLLGGRYTGQCHDNWPGHVTPSHQMLSDERASQE